MTTPGYAGKILLVDLSKGTGDAAITRLDTEKYEKFGGGYGMGAAMFWDYCVAPGDWDLQDAFNPRNMFSLMTGPLSGTGVPGAPRTCVSGMSPMCYPIQWFSHSNFGGLFATMLKMAGWDGVSVIGRAEHPVYINIVDDKVTIEDARDLWGLNSWECQEEIWKKSGVRFGEEWWRLDGGYSLQRPQIVTMGAAGENLTRVASVIHGGGSGAGQGGLGGVMGSKNLKAVAALGTGKIKIADPKGMRDTRDWWDKTWPAGGMGGGGTGQSACVACGPIRFCHNRGRNSSFGQDSDGCAEGSLYYLMDHPVDREQNLRGSDICQQYSISGMECCFQGPLSFDTSHNPNFPIQPRIPAYAALGWYMKTMYDMKVIGPGTKFDISPLPMEKYGSKEFMEVYAYALANRVGIGNLLAEGTDRFCEALGRKDDFDILCRRTPWGYVDHWSMPNVEWAFSNLFDSRDVNCHDFGLSRQRNMTCEEYVKILAERTGMKDADEFWFDYSWEEGDQAYKTGIYSEPKAKFVTWHHHYWLYYKESIGFCDWGYMRPFSASHPQGFGHTPEAEPRWMKTVTGKDHSFAEDGIRSGRRIFSLLRAIYAMQGRHKNMEKFNGYYYRPGASYCGFYTERTVFDGREWDWQNCRELYFSDKGIETMKSHVYRLEGWNVDSGYPTRKTLEELDLKYVADYLQTKGKLG